MRIVDNPFPYIKCETCKYANVDHSLSGYHLECRIHKEKFCGDMRGRSRRIYPYWKGRETSGSSSDSSFSSCSTEADNGFIKKEEMTL